jgi:CIC family chloride channel protein
VTKKIILAMIVGAIAWALTTILRLSIEFSSEHLFELFEKPHAGQITHIEQAFFLIFAVLFGAAIRVFLHKTKSWRSVEGDGATRTITYFLESYRSGKHYKVSDRLQRPTFLEAFRRMFVTIITLGFGGSGGLEGPVIPIGENIGAGICKIFGIKKVATLRALQMAGIAATVCTLLNAPFAAAIFASEVVYSERIIYKTFLYSIFSVVIADALNQIFFPGQLLFHYIHHSHSYTAWEYLQVILVAVFCSAPAGVGITYCFDFLQKAFGRLTYYFKIPLAMLIAVSIALTLWFSLGIEPTYVLGVGEKTISDLLLQTGNPMLHIWWVIFIIIAAKAMTTGLTLASGGSAGKLVPAMILGGAMGAGMYHFLVALHIIHPEPYAIFIISGIASALVAIIEVPIATIVLIIEIFGASFAAPAMIAVGICHLIATSLRVYIKK